MVEQDKALKELDALFQTARADQPELSDGLMAAILDDAARVQDTFRPASMGSAALNQPSIWSRFFATLGGGLGVGGLVTAGLAGIWVGVAPPSFLPDPVDLAAASSSLESDPFDGFDLSELMSEDLQ
ncbi:hypothetical protein KMP13_19315 [Epibacterium ulvae]|uniref:hypothetical protein n=1 Tax=Epibacterium ulvae TaxID=1156985 RepID=UPI001BFBF8FE|nr:hypothetical protein [Epibacterium ulvae]MBT8155971.1 hypothetical protein [Epibacterium ulvae]